MKRLTSHVSGTTIVLALTAIQSLAQSTHEPYTFTTLAGGGGYSTNQAGSAARLWNPMAVAVDSAGNVYVADQGNNSISKVTPAGAMTTLAGRPGSFGSANGTGSDARFNGPSGVAVDSAGNVYVADFYFNTIRKGYAPPRILNSGFVAGQFRFDLTGPPGQLVVVEASSDLMSWLPVWTNTSTLNFSDPQSGAYPDRFYRTRVQ